MRVFTRRDAPVDAAPAASTTALPPASVAFPATAVTVDNQVPSEKPYRRFLTRTRQPEHVRLYNTTGSVNRRPHFSDWLKVVWLDILTMVVMGALGLGIFKLKPAPTRTFPVYFQDGEVVYPEFAYPMRRQIIPIWLSALLGVVVPIFVFLCMQIRSRSFWDLNNAVLGLLYSLITAAVFQVFLKWLIGGLRPHFLAVCKPDLPVGGPETGRGFGQIMYTRKICTGDTREINDSLESFPSGHATAAFAGFVFLYLYINAKLKVWGNYHPAMWKLALVYAPILGATLIAGTLTIDAYHNWYDIVAGATIGTVMAFSAYRTVYASIWDFRFNHIPLARDTPFTYRDGESTETGFHRAVGTRKAGWGSRDGAADAPHGAPARLSADQTDGASDSINGGSLTGTHHHQYSSPTMVAGSSQYGQDSIGRRPVPPAKNIARGEHMV